MQVKFKRLAPEAKMPTYASPYEAGADLTATSRIETPAFIEYGTSLSVEIPDGYVGLLFPRSSISKKELMLANSVGVVDSSYRGEIKLRFKYNKTDKPDDYYSFGDRIGQLVIMPYPKIEYVEAEELTDSVRGDKGFGSTGV